MKLPIKKKWFDKIKNGEKLIEYRDAHITFVCEETGETLHREVYEVSISPTSEIDKEIKESGCISDDWVIVFELCDY